MAKTDTAKTKKKTDTAATMREAAGKGAEQAKVVYGQFSGAAEDAASMLDEQASVVRDAAAGFHLAAVEIAQRNANAGFDFSRKLLAARDLEEVVALQAEFAREQSQALMAQSRELGEITAKLGEQAARPFRESFARSAEMFRSCFPV